MKRGIALILSLLILFSSVPVTAFAAGSSDDASPASLLPIKEYKVDIELSYYFDGELTQFPVSEFTRDVKQKLAESYPNDPDLKDLTFWYWTRAVSNSEDSSQSDDSFFGDMNPINENGYIDLHPEHSSTGAEEYADIELIAGKDDQLELSNKRIIVHVKLLDKNIKFKFTNYMETAEGEVRQKIQFSNDSFPLTSNFHLSLDSSSNNDGYVEGVKTYLSMSFDSDDFNSSQAGEDLDVSIYQGAFDSETALNKAVLGGSAKEITDQIWDQGDISKSGGYLYDYTRETSEPQFTMVIRRSSKLIKLQTFNILVSVPLAVVKFNCLKTEDNITLNGTDYLDENGTHTVVVYQTQGTSNTKTFRVLFKAWLSNDAAETNNVSLIKAAYAGKYKTEEEIPSGTEDIKAQLFSATGYLVEDITSESAFTVITVSGRMHHFQIRLDVPNEQLVPAPSPLSEDTYFSVEGVAGKSCYVMPFEDDSYYYNGFQTLFLLEENGNSVPEGSEITPIFKSGPGVHVYASQAETDISSDYIDTASAVVQESGKSKVPFKNGQAVLYSAGSESGNRLKNYWVTFLTQQEEPTLYVNGINGPSSEPVEREIFLTEEYDYHHDILIANIGKTELKNISVAIEAPLNVKFDDSSAGIDVPGFTLPGFTSLKPPQADNSEYAQQDFITKLRLIPDGKGDISGTLVIKAGGTDGQQEQEYRIKLTGTAVTPRITTTKLIPSVRYVPYYSLIQTNNMHGGSTSSNIVFSVISGSLPDGIQLEPNGELHGTPTAAGDYTFTVAAKSADETETYDTKQFTLHIVTNDDEAVWNYDKLYGGDSNYKITVAIPDEDNETISNGNLGSGEVFDEFDWSSEARIMETEGNFDYFIDLWLDGVLLTKGVDYTADPGSTRLTIFTQTLTGHGNGTHTLAAEFREGSRGAVRRAAQNYKLYTIGRNPAPPDDGENNVPKPAVDAELKYLIPDDDSSIRISHIAREHYINGLKVITVQPDESQYELYKKSMKYNVVFEARMNDTSTASPGASLVSAAYEGDFRSKNDIPGTATDIRDQLFSETGYPVDDFSNGAYFTILTSANQILNYQVQFDEINKQLPKSPRPISEDTFFHVKGVTGLEYYAVPYEDDSYYYNGFQTVFLRNADGQSVKESDLITPVFQHGTGINVYAGASEKDTDSDYINTSSAVRQTSGKSTVKFSNGQAVLYSASSESGNRLKNYWVTFLTPQDKPTLYVNGINSDPSSKEPPQREVFLTEEYNFFHDILIANIGTAELKNISVALEDPQHVKLDPYWTVNDNGVRSLSGFDGFTSSNDPSQNSYTGHGQQKFLAKIRLLPDGKGDISGTLVIKAGGTDGQQEQEYRIKLTGTAVTPRITTTKLIPSVRYVPYYSLIQTNNMHGGSTSSNIVFSVISGSLPDGIQLEPNGELHGTPTAAGDYTFTVAAKSADETETYDTKQFTLHIVTNDDEAVWNYDKLYGGDSNYKITVAIPNEDNVTISGNLNNEATTDQRDWSNRTRIMETEGEFSDFTALWLDGRELERGPGKDYTAEEGSTKLTVMTETLLGVGSGTHTLAAEFRDANGTVRRAAQNYKLENRSSNPGSGTGGGGGGGGGSSSRPSAARPVKPAETENGSVSTSVSEAKKGDTVTFTVTPEEGYEVGEVTVTDAKGNSVPVTAVGNNTYTFTMPDSEVSIKATFKKLLPDPVTGLPFYDVHADDWFLPYIQKVYEKGLMIGTSADTFRPLDKTQRAMIVTVLHRLAGTPETEEAHFTDVPEDAYYAQAVNWAAENDIIAGYGDGKFGPEDDLSREQIVLVLMSYARYAELDTTASTNLDQFADSSDTSDFAAEGMSWAVAEGLIQGKGDGRLDPKGTATRSEVAALLVRFSDWAESQEKEPEQETEKN